MHNVSLFMETLQKLTIDEKWEISSKLLEHKNVREFLYLGKKVLIDNEKLSKQEQKRIKELYKTDEVQTLISEMTRVSKSKFTRFIPNMVINVIGQRLLMSYLVSLGLTIGGAIGISLFVSIVNFALIAVVLDKVFPAREQKKIIKELQKLNIIDKNLELDPTWSSTLSGELRLRKKNS